jgi:hypothetical protein
LCNSLEKKSGCASTERALDLPSKYRRKLSKSIDARQHNLKKPEFRDPAGESGGYHRFEQLRKIVAGL